MPLPYALGAILPKSLSLGKTTISTTNDTELWIDRFYKYDPNGRPIIHGTLISDAGTLSIDTSGALNDFIPYLGIGSRIRALTDEDGTPTSGVYIVKSNDGNNVDLSNLSFDGQTDTD
jgi:hypothetical protein